MKHIITLFLCGVISFAGWAQSFDKPKMDSLFSIIEGSNMGMNRISIFQDGKEVYQNSIGYSDVENDTRNTSHTLFRIGSISKTFTATLVMKMVELGVLSLEDRLETYFPEFEHSDQITIEDLLRHSSGIFNFTQAEDFQSWMFETIDREELVAKLVSYGSVFEPSTKAEYSNSNYVILTFILEDVSGQSYNDLLQEIICLPCGLEHTYLGTSSDKNIHEANSYYFTDSWNKFPATDLSIPLGAGAIVSNPTELNQFLTCLFSNGVLDVGSLEKMKTGKFGYGLGMFSSTFMGMQTYGHNGAIDAFTSDATYYPSQNVSISITCNGLGSMDQDVILEGVAKIYFGMEYKLPAQRKAIHLELDEFLVYEGTYSSPDFPLKISIFTDEEGLVAQATGQDSFQLIAVGQHTFIFDPAGIELIFDPKKKEMVLNQGSGSYRLTREE